MPDASPAGRPEGAGVPPGDGTALRIGVVLLLVGMFGLFVGWTLFPDSNLLGGLALVFGPAAWVGAAVLVGEGLRRVLRAVGSRGDA